MDDHGVHAALLARGLAGLDSDVLMDHDFDTPLLGLLNVQGTPQLRNLCVNSIHMVMLLAIDQAVAILRGQRSAQLHNPESSRRTT